jgi:hypothetical protein
VSAVSTAHFSHSFSLITRHRWCDRAPIHQA